MDQESPTVKIYHHLLHCMNVMKTTMGQKLTAAQKRYERYFDDSVLPQPEIEFESNTIDELEYRTQIWIVQMSNGPLIALERYLQILSCSMKMGSKIANK